MRPVNLLPPSYRPRASTGTGGGRGAYVVIGALAALLGVVGLYTFTAHSISSRHAEADRLAGESTRLERHAAALGPFVGFARVKASRVNAVRELAGGRLDWERLVRETARLLPAGVWLTGLDASIRPGVSAGGSSSGSPSPPPSSGSAGGSGQPAAATGAAAGPTMTLTGCAPEHRHIAATLARLRRLQRASDVQLTESNRPDQASTHGGSGGSTTAGSEAGPTGCGERRGRANLEFTLTVALSRTDPGAAAAGSDARPVPASLGGGT